MGIKKTLGFGVATAALGLTLIGGGTFAYFSDSVETTGTFAAGTLDLNADPTAIIDVGNLKPGDTATRTFKLKNDGTLDIAKVLLKTTYTVVNKPGAPENTDDFGKHIVVRFLKNIDKKETVIYQTTLYDLQNQAPDAVENKWVAWFEEHGGLKAGDTDDLIVNFEFKDNGQDQNEFQGDALNLKWTFEAKQGAGEIK
ncbi:cell division protein FtsN [Paenibacillus macerans]|uniref:Cell division protein FtsN n=1 Tax=Paenibacillus macerans TaxID=44252 RepID=A0A6N8ET74_PAEMA|nr:TasA family protein [Paenibacillus macerans]MED4956237.1 TasA family protein [Paenibacillus macerans]MUG22000.1 cell division protein FtsN [Paenibacillus macerans]OMG48754.1 cell division protein FtsN [Paenibacillus macerans]GJM76985.1 cell division protein FtsN [Paenibacillus macerans]